MQRIWLFLENEEYRPFDGCKIEIYTFTKYVFLFFSRFFSTKSKKISKTQNFTLISNPLKKLLENAQKKSYKQKKFDEHE